ncbi:MAG: 4-hydroxy-tetrahydrodipicolinate reductase [Oscillospiraceae bacterium]
MKVLVNGALGRMGSIVVNQVEAAGDLELAAAVDVFSSGGAVLSSLEQVASPVDVVIDFSHHTLTAGLLNWAADRNIPVVLCTTGHDDSEKAAIAAAAEKIPVFYSANMSMGVALLAQLAKKAASVFPDADIEIVETHHNRKADAPSGTALMLGEAIKEVRPNAVFKLGRSGMGKRSSDEIGFHAIRMGNIPGIHEIHITTDTQSITLKHEVFDRALLAEGSVSAARFLIGKPAGMYDMQELIS